jgi:hypothetical protein
MNNSTGSYNIAIGHAALLTNSTGGTNNATGFTSLYNNTVGNSNNAIGTGALYANVAGSNGVAIGHYSQYYANSTATPWTNTNTSVGYQSLQGSTIAANNTGLGNSVLGYQAMLSNTTGSNNTAIGTNAGFGDGTTAPQKSTIDNNATFVGYQASRDIVANTTALTNITAIGYMAKVSQNNSLILGGTGANAVSVGIGNTAPDASAVLDVTSTTKGALLPRVTTGQKMLIVTPAAGLIVYDNTLNQLQVYNGSSWGATAAASGWNLTGSAGTTAGTNFIGTTDDVDVVFKRNGVQSGLLNNALANTSFGVLALNPGTTGINNTALGYQALKHNTTGSYNIGTGLYALSSNTTGGTNVATGAGALFSNVAGS